MLRASEFAARLNTEEWLIWESIILELEKLNKTQNLNSYFKGASGDGDPALTGFRENFLEENLTSLIL